MSKATQELVALADKLGLSEKQRRYAEHLASDPERNQTQAALNAGYAASAARSHGSRLASDCNIQTYMAALIEKSKEAVNVVAMTEDAVMETAEVMLRLSRQGRADIGKHLSVDDDGNWSVRPSKEHTDTIRHLKSRSGCDKDGMAWTETEIKVADPVPALQSLARIYGLEKESDSGKVVNINIEKLLAVVSPEQLREANRLALMGGPEKD